MQRTIVRPCPRSVAIASRTTAAASGSSAAVGSSRKRTGGSWSRARAIASFCFMPLLNVPVGSWRRSHRSKSRRSRSIRSARTAVGNPWSFPKKSRLRTAESFS